MMVFSTVTTSAIYMHCITLFFQPLKQALDEFVRQWNNHGVRTVNSIYPFAILYSEVETGIDNFDTGNISLYGLDPIVNSIETENMVIVPESTATLSTDMQMNNVCCKSLAQTTSSRSYTLS